MRIKLKNVRLSFPKLFQPATIKGSAPKFAANFLIEKTDPQLPVVMEAIEKVTAEKWPTGKPKGLKTLLHEGSEKEYEGYSDSNMFVSASSAADRPPIVVDPDKSPLTSQDKLLHPGCYVNAVIDLWAQDNQYGKRINGELIGVQYAGPGEQWGTGKQSASLDDF